MTPLSLAILGRLLTHLLNRLDKLRDVLGTEGPTLHFTDNLALKSLKRICCAARLGDNPLNQTIQFPLTLDRQDLDDLVALLRQVIDQSVCSFPSHAYDGPAVLPCKACRVRCAAGRGR